MYYTALDQVSNEFIAKVLLKLGSEIVSAIRSENFNLTIENRKLSISGILFNSYVSIEKPLK